MERTPLILIVDDDPSSRDVLARLLSNGGYAVRTAANGWEALLAADPSVDLILLDMMLPGMDGPSFLEKLRRLPHGKHVPVVVISSMDVAEVAPRVEGLGVSSIITKGGKFWLQIDSVVKRNIERPRPQARVQLPGGGRVALPYLELYLKMLAWS